MLLFSNFKCHRINRYFPINCTYGRINYLEMLSVSSWKEKKKFNYRKIKRNLYDFWCKICLNTKISLLGGWFKISDKVSTLLGFLQASENHLCSRNIFLGILQVLKESVFWPCNSLWFVSVCIGETRCLACLAAEKPVEIWSDLGITKS